MNVHPSVELAAIADIQSGFAFPSRQYTESGHFLMRIGNVQDGRISLEKPAFVQLDRKTEKFALSAGDFLTSLTGYIGRVARVEANHLPAALNQRVARLRVKPDKALPDYVGYFLQTDAFRLPLEQKSHGAAQANVSPKEISKASIRLPSLEEQKRIVAVLDQTFAALDRARALAEANLADAKELFSSEIAGVISSPPQDWRQVKLGQLVDLISGQHIDAKDYNTAGRGIGYLTGPSDFGPYFPVVSKWTEHPKRKAKGGDILITVKGSGVGSINMMEEDELAISRQLMAVRAKPNERDFIYFILEGSFAVFQNLANGSAIPGISRADVLDLELALPPASQLQAVVVKLQEIKEKSRKLSDLYARTVGDLDNLRQALLQQAFDGELT